MDANEKNDTVSVMIELNNKVFSDTEEPEGFLFHHEADSGDFPPSLLSYFETSKSRAAVCEKLILEELEDLPALHHSEDMMNLPCELDMDRMKPNEQIICDPENEENNTFTDTRLLPAPTQTHNVSVCHNNEDEAERDEYMESERQFLQELEAEREKRRCEEMKQEEQKRQIEKDFQRELEKLMEAEKLQQRELESMARRAQEKLEEELLLQQELMSSLRRRVEEERRVREEEQRRIKDEEETRRREEEKVKMEAERKRKEEERRMREEEQRRIKDEEETRRREEEKVKMEAERKRKEEERRMREEEQRRIKEEVKREEEKVKMEAERKRKEEERRMREEEERKIEELKLEKEQERTCEEEEKKRRDTLEKKKLEDKMKMMEEEERKNKENEEKIEKEEEGRKKREEERKNIEAARKIEKEMSQKKEEEEREKREEKNMITQEEMRITEETEEEEEEEEEKQKEVNEKKEGEEALKKMCEEMKDGDEIKYVNVDEGMKLDERKRKEERDRKRREEEKRDSEKQEIDEREVKDVMRNKEGENQIIKEEPRPVEEVEKSKKEDDWKIKEEEGMRRQNDEMRENEEQKRKLEEGKKSESKTKDYTEEKHFSNEELRKREEERKSAVAEKKLNDDKINKEREEEIRLKIKQDRETGEIMIKASELQEKREKTDETENNGASQDAVGSTWTSWREPTKSPIRPESTPQHPHPEESISQTSTGCENGAARPSTVCVCLPVCLPQHTEEKRLAWMKDCTSWSKLSLHSRRKQNGSVRSRRALRGAPEGSSLPPLCPDSLLQAAGCKSLQEVTSVTLEDLPGCSLSTLAQCTRLQSLTLRRCGLRSLEGFNHLPQLCYIDVQENEISYVDCENMKTLRVLQLSHNKLTSIHGLNGAEHLDVLDLSHNSITRIAGLESMRRLQRLSVDHNQLISTKGLRDVCTLLHLSCSHNHLAGVEGLENSALLNTLDLRANSLTEPPSLNNHVLLRELHLEDNSISSLQGFAACWLPLMQHLSVAQNRITWLPSMSDFVSLVNLDLRYNCLSELQNVCEGLEGCRFLRDVHLTGNPLQQESGWSSTLQRAVPGLRASGDQQTDSFLTPPAALQVSSASGSFLMFCQAQLQQTHYLQQQHSRELSNASSPLDAVKTCCRNSSEALQLAKDQRFAHEYGDTTVAAGQTTPEETLDMDNKNAENHTEHTEVQPVVKNEDKRSYRNVEGTFVDIAAAPKTDPGCVQSAETKGKTTSSSLKMSLVSKHQDLVTRSSAAVVIQQLWRKYRQKCGNISSISIAERGGGGEPESGPSYINRRAVGEDSAATVIQALWRGFALRRRLASALAAVTCSHSAEDDTFEEVDVDEFVFDEAAIEKPWTLSLSEDSPPRRFTVTEQLPPLKPPVAFPECSQYFLPPPPVRRTKQAWMPEEQVNSAGQRVSPESSNRSKSPALTSVISGLSERSEKILEEWGFTDSHTALQMLKRAQNMKSAKHQQKKRRDPSVRLALFRNCSYRLGPVEARNRPAQPSRDHLKGMHALFQPPSSIQTAIQPHQTSVLMSEGHKVGGAEPGLQQAERAKQRLHVQAAQSDRDSESERFLPEISSDVLNGGRVQLMADPVYTERRHHASGLRANNSLAAQPCKENNYPRRNSLGHARKEAPSPQRVKSAPSRKERISFRDNPVRLSDGWGGGKKRDKVHK